MSENDTTMPKLVACTRCDGSYIFKQSCALDLEHTGQRKCHLIMSREFCVTLYNIHQSLLSSYPKTRIQGFRFYQKRNNIGPLISVVTWSLFAQLFVQGGDRLGWWTCWWPSC